MRCRALQLGAAAIVMVAVSCVRPVERAAPEAATPSPPATTPVPITPAPEVDRGSLYDLAIGLEDHGARTIALDVHRGHVTLVSMFYSSCPAACPTLISDLKKVDAQLTPQERSAVRVLLVSMDRDKDSPASFRELADLHGLDLARWTLAEPTEEAGVRAVAAALNTKYRKLPDGNISHSSIVTVLRVDGGLDLAVEGLARDNSDIVARLRELLAPSATRGDRSEDEAPAPQALGG